MTNTKAKLEFVHAMARNTRATVRQCEALMRYAATLQRLAVEQCNREWTERDEAKRERIRSKVSALCVELGRTVDGKTIKLPLEHVPVFSNDPRGAVLKIRVPSGFTNDWGKEGICVPS